MEYEELVLQCINHRKNFGDDDGQLSVSPMGDNIIVHATDTNGADKVAVSVILSRESVRALVNYVTPFAGGVILENVVLVVTEEDL